MTRQSVRLVVLVAALAVCAAGRVLCSELKEDQSCGFGHGLTLAGFYPSPGICELACEGYAALDRDRVQCCQFRGFECYFNSRIGGTSSYPGYWAHSCLSQENSRRLVSQGGNPDIGGGYDHTIFLAQKALEECRSECGENNLHCNVDCFKSNDPLREYILNRLGNGAGGNGLSQQLEGDDNKEASSAAEQKTAGSSMLVDTALAVTAVALTVLLVVIVLRLRSRRAQSASADEAAAAAPAASA